MIPPPKNFKNTNPRAMGSDRGRRRLTGDDWNSGEGRRLVYSGAWEAWLVLDLGLLESNGGKEREKLGDASSFKLEVDEDEVDELVGSVLRRYLQWVLGGSNSGKRWRLLQG